MTPQHTLLYQLADGTDLFEFEYDVQTRLTVVRTRLEQHEVAKRFARIFDSALCGLNFPEDNPVVDLSVPVVELIELAHSALLLERQETAKYAQNDAQIAPPKGFSAQLIKDPTHQRLLLKVVCDEPEMLLEFNRTPEVTQLQDHVVAQLTQLSSEKTHWHFTLNNHPVPAKTVNTSKSVLASLPDARDRARTLAPLVCATAARQLLTQTPAHKIAETLGKISTAPTPELVTALSEVLPSITSETLLMTVNDVQSSFSVHLKEITQLTERALHSAFIERSTASSVTP